MAHNKEPRAWACAVFASLIGTSCVGLGDQAQTPAARASFPAMPSGAAPGASPQAWSMAHSLGRGINFGNIFEPPAEGAWGLRFEDGYADEVVKAGFNSVRLPVRWSNHAALTVDATLDEAFAQRIDHAIDELLKRQLVVVLNVHHYRQLDGDKLDPDEAAVAPSIVQLRFLNLWKQIAWRYRDKPAQLVFELYNEPHGALQNSWNDLAARALATVRQSNPKRVVMIGPTAWNSAAALKNLVLPNDADLIVTVHNYDPFEFTHQGAEWSSGAAAWLGTTCCSAAQLSHMRSGLDVAADWSARNRYPIYLGEFGAYGKAAMASRVTYTRTMRQEAEKRGFSWSYWEFAAGFGAYDPAAHAWRQPIKDALLAP